MDEQKKEIKILVDEARKIVENEQTDLSHLNQLLSRQALMPFANWIEKKPYTRICLYEDLEFELILICWSALSKTAIHNHNKQNCHVFFFDADFQETIYCDEGQEVLEVNNVKKGGISFMKKKNSCHSLQNLSTAPAMSLHLYNKPIKTCEIIRQSEQAPCLEMAVLEYDAKLSH